MYTHTHAHVRTEMPAPNNNNYNNNNNNDNTGDGNDGLLFSFHVFFSPSTALLFFRFCFVLLRTNRGVVARGLRNVTSQSYAYSSKWCWSSSMLCIYVCRSVCMPVFYSSIKLGFGCNVIATELYRQ